MAWCIWLAGVCLIWAAPDAAVSSGGVAAILADHDRALARDLVAYITAHAQAEDVEQAYRALFDRVIDHDWFADHEALARRYLAERPEGAVRPLAYIITTIARAKTGAFAEALGSYRELMKGLTEASQEEFAANFADALAAAATSAGETGTARAVYQLLGEQFPGDAELKRKVTAEIGRLDMVGQPAPSVAVKDVDGKPLRLADRKGHYVLIEFWATWCAPCLADLPGLKATAAKYQDKGLEVVGVSLDETVGPVAEFVRATRFPGPRCIMRRARATWWRPSASAACRPAC